MEKYLIKNNVKLITGEDGLFLIYYYGNRYFIEGNFSENVLNDIFSMLKTPRTIDEIIDSEIKVEKDILINLIESLLNSKLIEVYNEIDKDYMLKNNGLNNFFQYFSNGLFNISSANVKKIEDSRINIIDMSNCGIFIANNLKAIGVKNVRYYNSQFVEEDDINNYPGLYKNNTLHKLKIEVLSSFMNNIYMTENKIDFIDGDLIIVCGSWFDIDKFKRINKDILDNGKRFLPIIEDYFGGIVGPIIGIKDGPCFNCLINRKKLNLNHLDSYEKIEEYYMKNRNEINIGFELFTKQLALTATTEVIKYITDIILPNLKSGLYEIDFFNHRSRYHNIFKDFKCDICN